MQSESLISDPLIEMPGYLLRRISALQMARLTQRLKPLSLRPADATVLMIIDANPGVRQSAVGRMLDIASANMAPLIARFEDRGLIDRTRLDGRSSGLKLSEAGRRLTRRAVRVIDAHEAAIIDAIPAQHRKAVMAALQALVGA